MFNPDSVHHLAALLGAAGVAASAIRQQRLKQLAKRILSFKEGEFSPSPAPHLLDRLTDYDLIVAREVVWLVAAEQQPPPSGKARYRLLAWTVADARGAAELLSKATAEKVGKRLEAQALKALGTHAADRSRARAAAEKDAALAQALPAALAAIDAAERLALEAAQAEVYVGFYELDIPATATPAKECLE